MDDMTRANCPVCVTVASERCSFCLRSKLSTTSRMHLEELGKRLLDRDPNLSAAALLEVLRNYGRSSRFAAETNASCGAGIQAVCILFPFDMYTSLC